MKTMHWLVLAPLVLMAGCGPSPEEQRAMDQQSCAGYGFPPGSDAFATCMMKTAQQRAAQQAADQRAAAAREAAEQRANAAQQAARAQAASQAPSFSSSSSSSSSPFGPSPVDKVRDQIQNDIDKMSSGE
jgi:hypothetical protein